MVNAPVIQKVIACSLRGSEYYCTARKHNLPRLNLIGRSKGETASKSEANSTHHELSTNAQESIIIKHIQQLSDRGIHPNPQKLETLIVQIVEKQTGKCWNIDS